jgi:hypothetical protein
MWRDMVPFRLMNIPHTVFVKKAKELVMFSKEI